VSRLQTIKAARAGAARPDWTHAASYRGASPAAVVHRRRLRSIVAAMQTLELPERGRVLDFGCSDGFVLAELRAAAVLPEQWVMEGYDRGSRLLAAARARQLANADFFRLNLNDARKRPRNPGDLVLCFETLEHIGDYRAALAVLHSALKPGGYLLLSMPNEVGVVGLAKLVGRPLLRNHPYRGFFRSRHASLLYGLSVASGRNISQFRTPARSGWGPHLGFDYREALAYIDQTYLRDGQWTLHHHRGGRLRPNVVLAFRRVR